MAKRDRTMGHKEAAEFLSVAPKTLYSWVNKRLITVYKSGRKNVYRESELEQFLDRNAIIADRKPD